MPEKSKEKLLTIVIPAYNMEAYLDKCLASLIVGEPDCDLMRMLEVLVINDGSTDSSSAIAHRYEERYPDTFKVIDKDNGNYGSCMNVGLKLAAGKYFRTLDADDWYDIDAFIDFVCDLRNTDADVVLSEKVDHYLDSSHEDQFYKFPSHFPICKDVSFDDIDWNDSSLQEMMGVMFLTTKTSLLREVRMKWSEGVFYSDFEYIMIPLFAAETVRLSPFQVYQYLLGRPDQSVSYSVSLKNRHSFAVVLDSILNSRAGQCFHSQGASTLFQLKLQMLIRIVYYYFFQKEFVLSPEILSIESQIYQDEQLKSFTDGLEGFRGHRYVAAYRSCRLLFYIYCIDYRLRTNAFLRKLLKKNR